MATLRVVNLAVRFLLELGSLAAFGYWGATLPAGSAVRVSAAIALPLLVAGLWGAFISPKARVPTGRAGRAGLGLVVFLAASALLYLRGHEPLAVTFAIVALISSIVVYALPQ